MHSTRWLLPLLVGLSAVGCAASQPLPAQLPYEAKSPYAAALTDATQGSQVYRQLETMLLARATLHTPAFQQAYVREYARMYALTESAAAAQVKASDKVELIIQVSSQDLKLASLAPADGVWRLSLVNAAGQEAAPLEVSRVRTPSQVDRYFYPYLDGLGRVYRLTFPAAPEGGAPFMSGGEVTLKLAGVAGQTALTWSVGNSR